MRFVLNTLFKAGLPTGIRFKSAVVPGKYRSLQSYLDHTQGNKLSTVSSHFVGTLYELTTLKFLEDHLGVTNLLHSGGTSDNGIDLRGQWAMDRFLPEEEVNYGPLKVTATGNRVKPLVSKKNAELNLLVQCKAYRSKIGSSVVRELSGSFKYTVRQSEKNKTVLMIVAPTDMTRSALAQFDRSDFPLMLVNLSMLKLSGIAESAYEIGNYSGGQLRGYYMNPYCKVLLKDLTLENELKRLMITTKDHHLGIADKIPVEATSRT